MTTQTLEWTAERNARLYAVLSGDVVNMGSSGIPLTTGDGMLWVLERLRERELLILILSGGDGWGASVKEFGESYKERTVQAPTLPLAVALAAEKALGL